MLRKDSTNSWTAIAAALGAGWARLWAARYPFLARDVAAVTPPAKPEPGRRPAARAVAPDTWMLRWHAGVRMASVRT